VIISKALLSPPWLC